MTKYEEELRYWSQQKRIWENLEGKTILISGISGAVGRCLTELFMLHGGIQVIGISRNEQTAKDCLEKYWDSNFFRYLPCDVNTPIPECGSVDYIIHAASNTHPKQYAQDPIGTITANVFGTKNMLDYGISHGLRRFCFVSSVEIYGENRGDKRKFDESYLGYLDCNTLRAGYPESKRLGEALCNAYGEKYGVDFVIPRLSRVYGPTMLNSDSKAISQFIKKAKSGEDIVLKSRGEQEYSYVFVLDAAVGIVWSLVFGRRGEAYNVTDENSEITLKELAEGLAKLAGTRVVYEQSDEMERKGYSAATRAVLDGRKIAQIGWQARIGMEEGLMDTVGAKRKYRRYGDCI